MSEEKVARLPTSVTPLHYDVTLEPDLRTAEEGGTHRFEGAVSVRVRVNEPGVREIMLNAVELEVSKVTVTQNDAEHECAWRCSDETETGVVTLPAALSQGEAVVSFAYTGSLNDKMKGLYRSSYTSARSGKKTLMAVTQFEATDARRALPCWDEPSLKATFDMTLVVPSALQAVSNMAEKSREPLDGGRVRVSYGTTPKMSTYLLACVVGEFDHVEGRSADGVPIRVFTPVGKAEQGRFALDVAERTLPLYAKYFELSYADQGMSKLDMLAIPDFAAGAMENWGCVTYRETALLCDENTSSLNSKQWVALVVAHELAHAWFGNSVTMDWWQSLWLNEGFATFVEYLAVDHIFPEWQIFTQFVSLDLGRALQLDSLRNSHPVEVPVNFAAEVDEIFDAISYSKGSCIIRMLVSYLGEEGFRRGMAAYVRKHLFSNAKTVDLWDSLSEANGGKPVTRVMGTWTLQTGFPVVRVTGGAGPSLRVSQARFLSDGPAPAELDTVAWSVPLRVLAAPADASAEAATVTDLLEAREGALELPAGTAWFKFNAGQTGMYRVLYESEQLDRVLGAVRSKDPRLTPSDRLGLQSDAFALCRAGLMGMRDLLRVVDAYRTEEAYPVWSDLSANLAGLAGLVKHTDLHEPFSRWAASVYEGVAARLGWDAGEGESDLDTMLRTNAIGMLCKFGHAGTVAEAVRRFDAFVSGLDSGSSDADLAKVLSPDLRPAAYRAAVATRGRAAHEAVLRVYAKTDLNEEKVRCLGALGAAEDAGLLAETLKFGFDPELVRSQDIFYVLSTVQANRHGAELAWKHVQESWDGIVKRFGGSFMISRIVQGLQSSFADEAHAAEIEAFFAKNEAPAAERAVQQTLEKIRGNAAWLKRDEVEIRTFLASR